MDDWRSWCRGLSFVLQAQKKSSGYFFLQMEMSVCRNIYLAQVLKNSLYKLKKLLAFTPEIENF